jgi:hypothetical protein
VPEARPAIRRSGAFALVACLRSGHVFPAFYRTDFDRPPVRLRSFRLMILAVQAAIFLAVIAVGVHFKGVSIGLFGGLGVLVFVLAFGLAPGPAPVSAMLIIPAAAARGFSATPEQMAGSATLIGAISVLAGLGASLWLGSPAGSSIIAVSAGIYALSLACYRKS